MATTFLTSLSEEEFKIFLKSAISEIINGRNNLSTPDVPDILDAKQAADFLRLRISTLYEKTSEKRVPHFKRGNKLYFNRQQLQSWLEEGKVKTTDELQGEAASYSMHREAKKFNR